MKNLSKKTDLTRWNRAGLNRFRYLDGNAITFTETLRQAMVTAFTKDGENSWSTLNENVPPTETAQQRQDRWVDQYQGDRRDHGWEILRSYARASHVLTEHIDHYANEGYIGTATQWDNVKRLVEMLDYHPAPAASAKTTIALLAKPELAGVVSRGFALKNKPIDGSKPAIFETLEDLSIDHQLNTLRTANFDQSQIPIEYPDNGQGIEFPLSDKVEGVSIGTEGILLVQLLDSEIGLAVTVSAVLADNLRLNGEVRPAAMVGPIIRSQVRLYLKPNSIQSPQLHGSDVISLNSDHQLATNMKIAWYADSTYVAAQVIDVQGNRAKISKPLAEVKTEIFMATRSDAREVTDVADPGSRVILPLVEHRRSGAFFDANLNLISGVKTEPSIGTSAYSYFDGNSHSSVYYVAKSATEDADIIGITQPFAPSNFIFDGDSAGLATGQWVLSTSGETLLACQINQLNQLENTYSLSLTNAQSNIDQLASDFEYLLYPFDANANREPIFLTELSQRSNSHSIIPLQNLESDSLLTLGRKLIVSGLTRSVEVTIKSTDLVTKQITVAPAIPGSELTADGTSADFSRFDTIIYANVVACGHGETQNLQLLGSGDATQTHQSFDLDVKDISFESEQSFPAGVRCALECVIEGRTWKQVSSLYQSKASDHHYQIRVKEDATVRLIFGDGIHGRRLPTGNNNVQVVYKVGTGLNGNLSPYSLQKELKPHYLIDQVVQPLASAGGNDMEQVASMRDNAPASILTLERAVSLNDFTHLTVSNSSVWQARAYLEHPSAAQQQKIHVAVVPAGGGELGSLADELTVFLGSHALPGVRVTVEPYQSVIFDLNITVQVKTDQYDPDLVLQQVEHTLLEHFSIKQRKLGEPLFRSQVFQQIESVQGVANCQCDILNGFKDTNSLVIQARQVATSPNGTVKRVSADVRQVIFLDKSISKINLTLQSFSL